MCRNILVSCVLLVCAASLAGQQLTQVRYHLTGISLSVTPSALTVPRGVATQLNTAVTGAGSLPAGAAVRATLRGPSFPESIEIRTAPNQPIFLPPLTQAGTHFLENIRLDIDATTSIKASPSVVNINVLDQLLVGAVTSRPLSLAEIQQRGIVFDENSFQAFMFTVAFTTASGVRNIEVPVLVPIAGTPQQKMLLGAEIPQLNLQELPGLELPNLGLEALMLEPIEEAPPGVEIPPIPGILVIPGNIAFLNQFFSVFLTVSNRAPNGTPLVVRNVRAQISLPSGADGVMGNLQRDPPFAPGDPEFDNPLRVARTADGRQILKPVLAAGPDGVSGTADDVNVLVPQGSGSTEFLVEGIREGGHVIDIEIRGTLEGLPSGPIEVAGHVRGAVVVRDPNFSLTFIHPDVVRAGTQYDLTVQIRNTSLVDANLVTVSLDPRNMTGARLANPAQGSQTISTIRAGDSATVTLRLEALRTGRITASTLELAGETGVVSGRRLSLKTGVSEQGVPLSSDTLILPPDVALLRERANNDDLTGRAMALLGEAHSIATAPRASLPLGVLPIPSSTVVQRAGELTSAARRLRLSYRADAEGDAEPLPDALLLTLQDLYFDFLGGRARDDGWDALYRTSRQARLFGAALAEVVGREAGPLGLADAIALQRHWADTESYRADHITISTSAAGGQVPVTLEVTDRLGRRLGGSLDPEAGRREIPGADVLTFESADVPTGQFAVLTRTDGSPYTATFVAERAGSVDLGIVVPDISGQLRHVVFRAVAVNAGERLTLTIRPRSQPPVTFDRAGVAVSATSQDAIVDGPPEVLGIVQMADINIDRFGRVVGVLFDEDVEKATAENPTSYVPGAASIPMIQPPALLDSNIVKGALVQFGGRIVLVGLRDPVGPFVDRTIDISGVRDLKNQTMAQLLGARILPDPDLGNGGQVTGRVLRADGAPVPGAEITYLQPVEDPFGLITLQAVTVKPADSEGRYGLDFVLQNPLGGFVIRARDVATGERGELTAQVRANGERLSLDIVLVGRGSIEGVVRLQNGTPVPNAAVRVISGTDFSTYVGGTDQNGFYRISGVTVGPVAVEVTTASSSARAAGVISGSGTTSRIDVTVFGSANGVVTGIVRLPDGSAAVGIPVTIASELSVADGPLPSVAFLDVRTTDAAGAFRFDRVPPAGYLVRAIEKARGFIGDARITVTAANGPGNPVSVVVFLAGTGSVSGQVLERVGASTVPVAGALVAGGTEIVTAGADGRYTIPAVPVGSRVIEAANPRTGARGSREVTILTAGQASIGIDIVLAPLARVTGRVISPEGQPVAGQEVRIVIAERPSLFGGRTFLVRKTQTAGDGTYAFDLLEPREYPLAAVRGNEVANGRARLSSLVTEDVVDLRLIRPTGRVSGRVIDETNLAVAARVSLKARVPNAAGILELADAGSTTSDPDRGFTFTALFPGPFTATATSFFSPDSAAASGTLTESNPVADNVVLVLSKNTGRLSGCVLTPGGTTIQPVLDGTGVPLPLPVFITSHLLRNELARDPLNTEPDGIRVDASGGCFTSSIPLPPDFYAIEVTDTRLGSPTFGLTAQAFASVERAKETTQDVRLLGLGSIVVEVVDATGQALPGVNVTVRRTTYPNDTRDAQLTVSTSTAPLVVDDLTEGPVDVSATVSLDPAVNVGGRDELRGFGGRATGTVVRDQQRILRVVVDSAGVVSGRFLRADGSTPVNRAQVQLMSTGRPTAFTLTDATGGFRFDGVAVGAFQLDGFDPATGRRAHTEGHLTQDGQHVMQDLRLGPIGTVRGVVLDATRTVPAAGAEVQLTIPNDSAGARRATAAPDGTFLFPSVPGGTATITAVSLERLSGRTEATLSTEGEVVDVEVLLAGSGRVEGVVRGANGALVAGAQVSLTDSFGTTRAAQAGTSGGTLGGFAFEVVPIGAFTVEARPPGALTPGDGGRATGEITTNGQTAPIDVTFQGTVTVGVVVSGLAGGAPVEVSLQSGGLFGGRATPTGQQDGVFMFDGIPRAPMTVSAKQTTPVGAIISASVTLGQGDLPPPGGRVVPDVQLVLTQVATVQGIVTAESGAPVSGARVTLVAGEATTLALTQSDGRFEFVGVPLDVALRIVVDGLNGGRAIFIGAVDDVGRVRDRNGNTVDVVTLLLDTTPPRLVATAPASGATAVPTNSVVAITFSERIDPATITSCTVPTSTTTPTIRLLESSGLPPAINNAANLCDDSNVVPVAVAVSADGRTVTLQPTRSLVGSMPHTVNVSRGAPDSEGNWTGGVLDLVGMPLDAGFTWNFVTRDDVPPTVLAMSPPTGAVNVPEESVVRITFSEPVAASSVYAASFAVVGPAGPVAGVRELILGNTVAVFTPTDGSGNRAQLQSNASYSVTVAGVIDLAGNVQRPQDIATATFNTRDTIAPTVSSLSAPAGGRSDESITLIATTANTDVASVEFFVDGVLSASSSQPVVAGEYRVSIVMPSRSIQVAARAIDTTGNVGALGAVAAVSLLPDNPPVVTIDSPATSVAAGTTVRFSVTATDDLAVAEVRAASSGAVTTTAARAVSPARTPVTEFFDIAIPESTAPGPLTFAAAAIDGKGQTSATASNTVNVTSPPPPVITSVSPSTAEQGQTLNIAIAGQDTNFSQGTTTASFGTGVTVNTLTVTSLTSAVANVTIAEGAAPGPRTVTVTTGLKTASLVDGFTVVAGTAVVTTVSPNSAAQGQSLTVNVSGRFTHFAQGVTTADFGPGVAVDSLTVTSATSVVVTIIVSPIATTGLRTVTLTTGGEIASLANGFTVQPGSPLLLSATPNRGQRGRELAVVVTGRSTNFLQGTTTANFGAGISVGGAAAGEAGPVTVTSPESLTANLVIGASAALGPRDVVIQIGSQTLTLAGGFTVTDSLSVEIANSVNEFSCTQGMHNWHYGYYDGPFSSADFQQMAACLDDPYYPGKSWWVDQARFWTSIRAIVSFPNGPISCGRELVEHWAVRRWSSEVAGLVTVNGTVYNALGGGEFRAHILVDGVSVFTQIVSETTPIPYSVTFPVALGSTVDFAIQPNGSDCNDHAAFTATIVADASVAGPIVTSVSPPDGANGVSVDAAVRVTFSKAVNASSVTASTFRLLESRTPPLVVNGGFDTSATAWNVSNVDASGGWFASGGNPGGYFILNDAGGATDPSISQVVSGLVVGQRYRLSGQFISVYPSFGDPAASSFGVLVDNVLLGELARPPEGTWKEFAIEFTATSSEMTISLTAERNGDDSSYGVDNIALEPIVNGSVEVSSDALSATFTPAASLRPGTVYHVEVAGIADPAGQVMSALFRSTFVTAVVVGADSDGDGFPDTVEIEAGSDPLLSTSTPLSVQPPITEAVSPGFAVLNTTALTDASDTAVFIGEATSAPFSVLNTSSPSDVTDPAVFVGEVVSAPFSVLNTSNLSDVADPTVFIGEVVSPPFVVQNTATETSTSQTAAARSQEAAQQRSSTELVAPVVSIVSPSNGLTIFEGQTINIAVDASGDQLAGAVLSVNGSPLAQDGTLPYVFTVTAPANVTSLTLEASASNSAGTVTVSQPVTLSVVPDPGTTVIGRLVDAAGMAVANRDVTVAIGGLRAEFFDFSTPLTALPGVNGLVPTYTRHVTAVNVRNPNSVFGSDPFGVGLSLDYAARLSGYLWIEQAGEYEFRLGADEGARLVIGGTAVIQMPTGQGQLQVFSQTVQLPAGWVPIEVTYYESIGDAELQLQYAPPGGELQVIPPGRFRAAMTDRKVRTDAFGQFVIPSVPANVPAVGVSGENDGLSPLRPPVPGGVTDFGDLVVE